MNHGEIIARHYATRQPIRLRWEAGTISAVEVVQDAPSDLWIAPPLIDLQINGYAGVDFPPDNPNPGFAALTIPLRCAIPNRNTFRNCAKSPRTIPSC